MSGETVLITCPQLVGDLDIFRSRLDERGVHLLTPSVVQQMGEAELTEVIGDVDGMIAGDDHLTRAVLERAPRLRVISKWGIGTDSIDLAAAAELGIRVTNTPGMFGDDVADVVIGYLVLLARRLHETDREVRAGRWAKPEGQSLTGKSLGVVGLGDIGSAVCRRALAMGMVVLGTDVNEKARAAASAIGVHIIDVDGLVAAADVISLNCPLTPETRHMFDGRRLDSMRRGGWIINTARGGLIDETALVERILTGQVGRAALDVFEVEPLPASSPLRELPHVILGSHNSSNTVESRRRTSERAIANVFAGLDEVSR